jgi:hypothetical protein
MTTRMANPNACMAYSSRVWDHQLFAAGQGKEVGRDHPSVRGRPARSSDRPATPRGLAGGVWCGRADCSPRLILGDERST